MIQVLARMRSRYLNGQVAEGYFFLGHTLPLKEPASGWKGHIQHRTRNLGQPRKGRFRGSRTGPI